MTNLSRAFLLSPCAFIASILVACAQTAYCNELAQDYSPPRKQWYNTPDGERILPDPMAEYRRAVEIAILQKWRGTWSHRNADVFFLLSLDAKGKVLKIEEVKPTAHTNIAPQEVRAAMQALRAGKYPAFPAEVSSKKLEIPIRFSELEQQKSN